MDLGISGHRRDRAAQRRAATRRASPQPRAARRRTNRRARRLERIAAQRQRTPADDLQYRKHRHPGDPQARHRGMQPWFRGTDRLWRRRVDRPAEPETVCRPRGLADGRQRSLRKIRTRRDGRQGIPGPAQGREHLLGADVEPRDRSCRFRQGRRQHRRGHQRVARCRRGLAPGLRRTAGDLRFRQLGNRLAEEPHPGTRQPETARNFRLAARRTGRPADPGLVSRRSGLASERRLGLRRNVAGRDAPARAPTGSPRRHPVLGADERARGRRERSGARSGVDHRRHHRRARRHRRTGARARGRRDGRQSQGRLPRQHEPRDQDADERDHRHDAPRAQHRSAAAPTRIPAEDPALQPASARGHQRHPRLLEDRGRQDGGRADRVRSGAGARQRRRPQRREDRQQGSRTRDRHRRRRAERTRRRPLAHRPGADQLHQQRGQIHRKG